MCLFQSCDVPWSNEDILMVASIHCALSPSRMKGLIKMSGVIQRVTRLCPGCVCGPLDQPLRVQHIVLESCRSVPELFRRSLLWASCARPGFPDTHLPVVSSKELTSLRGQMLARSELISLRVYQPSLAVCYWHWVCLWRESGMEKVSLMEKALWRGLGMMVSLSGLTTALKYLFSPVLTYSLLYLSFRSRWVMGRKAGLE